MSKYSMTRGLILCAAIVSIQVPAQQSNPIPELPKDAADILSTAAPLYDFSSPVLKPWHIKASYQLFDEKGNPSRQGIYEYWWAAPDTYRSTWKSQDAEHTEWTRKGEHFELSRGAPVSHAEESIHQALWNPLPSAKEVQGARLKTGQLGTGAARLSCVMAIPQSAKDITAKDVREPVPLGLFPTWCFDPKATVLQTRMPFVGSLVTYSHVKKVQDRLLALDIDSYEASRRVLSAKIEAAELISASAPEFAPDAQAVRLEKAQLHEDITSPKAINQVEAAFPPDERETNTAEVSLRVLVGRDGRAHELSVINATSAAFIVEAVRAVEQYRFQPALKDGQPMPVLIGIVIRFHRN